MACKPSANHFMIFATGIIAIAGILSIRDAGAEPINVGTERQLFIDDRFVAERSNVQCTLQMPDLQHESLLGPNRPWEKGRASEWSSILYHAGRFHLWYDAYQWDPKSQRIRRPTHCYCYAVSDDGIHFEKPDLGLFELAGTNKNNAVIRGIEAGPVFIDPFAPPEKRFRLIARKQPVGDLWEELAGVDTNVTWMLTSPDGVHWKRNAEPLIPRHLGATQSVVWDEQLNRWVLYLRAHLPLQSGATRRAFARILVDKHGLDKPLPLPANAAHHTSLQREYPIVIDIDDQDKPGAQVYVSNVFRYPRAQDVQLAFIPMWYDSRGGFDASDLVEVQLAFSRDGIAWRRPWRQPIITPGLPGSDSAGQIFPLQHPILVGHELWLYYHGLPEDHLSKTHRKGNNHLARAIWPDGRFVSLDTFSGEPGEVVTPSIRFEGNRLQLNMNAGASGTVRVAIEHADGTPVPGFALVDAKSRHGNDLNKIMGWKGNPDLSRLAGQPVRLRIQMTATRLYGFQFAKE